jgi:hypothetical protein
LIVVIETSSSPKEMHLRLMVQEPSRLSCAVLARPRQSEIRCPSGRLFWLTGSRTTRLRELQELINNWIYDFFNERPATKPLFPLNSAGASSDRVDGFGAKKRRPAPCLYVRPRATLSCRLTNTKIRSFVVFLRYDGIVHHRGDG